MLLDRFQIEETQRRFAANAAKRARNEKLIREGKLLQVDTPDRVNKFLARRGLVRSTKGMELVGGLQPDAEELEGSGRGEALERIMGTSDLMGIAFLERGLQIARSVGRVWVNVDLGKPEAYGTGFLVSPRLLLTNHHVLGDKAVAGRSSVQFDYALKANSQPYQTALFTIDPATFHLADRHLDYALVAVSPISIEGRSLTEFGWNSLVQEEGKAIAAQYGNIIQHPGGQLKQLTLRENRIVDVLPEFLHYTADTEGGSSGSPVYNDRWEVVALHHSGVWKTNAAGEPISVEGTVWRPEMGEDRIQWLYNEGIRVSVLLAHIKQQNINARMSALLQEMLNKVPSGSVAIASASTGQTAVAASSGKEQKTLLQSALAGNVVTGPDGAVTWTIPLQVSVSLGNPRAASGVDRLSPKADSATWSKAVPSTAAARESDVLLAAQEAFKRADVIGVRMGYVFVDGIIADKRALVVTVTEKKSIAALQESAVDPLPSTFQGFPVEVTSATVEDVVAAQHGPAGQELFARLPVIAEEITYVPPTGVQLKMITAKMRVTALASPDIGWPTLKEFIRGTKQRLVVGMYDFGAPHIVTAIKGMGKKAGFKKMTLTMRPHGSLDDKTKAHDLDNSKAATELANALKSKFECAFVTLGTVNGWVASAYHIKVAVRDSAAVWLSSGNWQSSNQPDITPLDDNPQTITALRTFNREWHAIVEHKGLATTLQAFLINDFKNNPPSTAEAQFVMPALPDLFVPETTPTIGLEVQPQFEYFKPFADDRQFTVTPILTPDDFVKPVVALINEAQSEILVQNQTFNAPTQSQTDLAELIDAIIQKQRQNVLIRIIIRSFLASKDRKNLELLTDRGLKLGSVRFQVNSHTKGIIIDRKKVLIGSQNWSQLGVTQNRDASLLFDDEPLAKYFGKIFDHDWTNLATPKIGSEMGGVRVANPGEATPAGFVRVNAADLLNPS